VYDVRFWGWAWAVLALSGGLLAVGSLSIAWDTRWAKTKRLREWILDIALIVGSLICGISVFFLIVFLVVAGYDAAVANGLPLPGWFFEVLRVLTGREDGNG
jgi:hypothetical protein